VKPLNSSTILSYCKLDLQPKRNKRNQFNCFVGNGLLELPYSHRDFADHLAKCIKEKFNQLTQNDVRLQRRKVLSGIVLTRNRHLESMEIICITTGTKCSHNEHRIVNGQSLNDCHAEIIARRCLIRYCYEQLRLVFDGNSDQSIFERMKDTNRCRIKSSIDFHLYISTVPCGDSRLFSLQEIPANLNEDFKRLLQKSRGLLRTKTEVNEGTIPILAKTIYQNIQTWDDERLLTMSCSDKLCRWNFIGLQGKKRLNLIFHIYLLITGALLSTLIEPIYYTSIIIGSLYHSEHIQRALFSRIEEVDRRIREKKIIDEYL
jgi:double stranded RNA-specific editase B